MAEVTVTQAPAMSRGGDWGDARFNRYYNRYLGELPLNKVSYDSLSTPERNVDELAQEVAAYLDPQLETTAKNLRRQTRQNYNTIDTEGAGRGMSRSTWVTDEKNAAYNAGMQGLADAYNNYNDALVSGVSERYENYLARKQALDQQNQKNQLETDKFNSQILTAQEQLAYDRAAQAWARTQPSGGGKKKGSTKVELTPADSLGKHYTVTGDGKVATTTKRRISGQYSGLM